MMNANQGAVINLENFLTTGFPQIDYQKIVLPGPQYIMSDDPEYIPVPEAIAVREAVGPGSVRLYVYNVNALENPEKADRKITALLRNTGNEKMYVRMLKYSSQAPSSDYFGIAKQGLLDYFMSSGRAIPSLPGRNAQMPGANTEIQPVSRVIEPGGIIPIDEQLEKNNVKYNDLAHGIYEFVIDQPGEIYVVQTDPESTGAEALKRIKEVYPSTNVNAGRGLFGVSNYLVMTDTILVSRGPQALIVADGRRDPWVKGWDSSMGRLINLGGNYGIVYRLEIPWKGEMGKGLALITWNPHSKRRYCGGMVNVMKVSDGKFPGGIVRLPADRLYTKGDPEAVLIQVFTPSADSQIQTIKLTYSPPGATCLPTPLVFVPVDLE